jgi:hypothetical protein
MQTKFVVDKIEIERVTAFSREINKREAQSSYDFGQHVLVRSCTNFPPKMPLVAENRLCFAAFAV